MSNDEFVGRRHYDDSYSSDDDDWSNGRNSNNRHYHDDRSTHYHYRRANESIGEQAPPVDNEAKFKEDQHLTKEDVYGIQTKIIYAEINGTLEEFAAHSEKSEWKMTPNVAKSFGRLDKSKGRATANTCDYKGDLNKCILLDAIIIDAGNSHPRTSGINITGMVPSTVTDKKPYLWVMPANVPHININKSIFSPDNKFTRTMYEEYGKCDLDSLNSQIRFGKGNLSSVDVEGIVWGTIMDNIKTKKSWAGAYHDIYDLNSAKLNNELKSPWVEIPTKIARDVHASISEDLKWIEKSFVNLNELSVKFTPTNADAWNNVEGLIGQNISTDSETQLNHATSALETYGNQFARIELHYISYDN